MASSLRPAAGVGPSAAAARARAARVQGALRTWLREQALPRWTSDGVDAVHGGFHELLGRAGPVVDEPRRARVQPRQVYALAVAGARGWLREPAGVVRGGIDYFLRHYRRPDGLFRSLVAPDGTPLDERATLYDQAFALLGLAAARRVLDAATFEAEAVALRQRLYALLKRPGPGFDSGLPGRLPLRSNPHMHLFEAALEWRATSDDPAWSRLADELAALVLGRLGDPGTGLVREAFDAAWRPLGTLEGRTIEPGHQFEWAWLLLRWRDGTDAGARARALQLVDAAERCGIRRGVVINALYEDLAVQDAEARLWPQTERLKAAARLARLTGEPRYWTMAAAAGEALATYLDGTTPGLWHDRQGADGEFLPGPSPASTLYHVVAAVEETEAALASTAEAPT